MPIALQKAAAPASRFVPRSLFRSVRTPFIPFTLRAASTMVPKLKDPSLLKQDVCYVNGEWIKAKSGKTFDVNGRLNRIPALSHEQSRVLTADRPGHRREDRVMPEFTKADTDAAIAAAATAFETFRTKTGQRGRPDDPHYLGERQAIADAKGEVTYAANFFEWFSEEAPRIYGDTIPSSVPGNRVWTIKEPVGVCGLITPWNFPAAMITRKIGPALATGCTVVCKAPGETPFTSLAIAELGHRAGIPKGVVGEALTTNSTVKKISFTGSTNVGKLLMKQCSGTLKKLSMELGGNAPSSSSTTPTSTRRSQFRSSGQTCVCANRIYVQSGIYNEFAEKFAAKVREFKVGNGFEEGVTHGPLIHDRAIDKVEAHIRDAEKKGGKVVVGGNKISKLGSNFYEPTVITGMTKEMAMSSEETFGPVAGLFSFKTEEEVVKLANATNVGLAGYFFSRDIQRVHRVAEHLEVGMVGVNTGLISDPASPFGGVKESGFGREGSLYGISEYQVTKMITYGGMGQPLQK
ncbi:succinate-semialdehyde dehydrogenase [Colletotrichum tofieldiae]|nr:succinate-semialdehyde dehydrogenase [Colletotrichum tofieldiae]